MTFTVAQVDQALTDATIDQLFAALGPTTTLHGGPCPRCGQPAWAVDTIQWVCDGHPAEWTRTGPGLNRGRHHDRQPGHRGTIHELRRHVAEHPAALARLLGAELRGMPLEEPAKPGLPPVIDVDGWLTPADVFRRAVDAHLDDADMTAWCRHFVLANDQDILRGCLEQELPDPPPAWAAPIMRALTPREDAAA